MSSLCVEFAIRTSAVNEPSLSRELSKSSLERRMSPPKLPVSFNRASKSPYSLLNRRSLAVCQAMLWCPLPTKSRHPAFGYTTPAVRSRSVLFRKKKLECGGPGFVQPAVNIKPLFFDSCSSLRPFINLQKLHALTCIAHKTLGRGPSAKISRALCLAGFSG
jgi:hypothetical protein